MKQNLAESLLQSAAQNKPDQNKAVLALVGKWAKTGLLEGLNKREQGNFAVLLENQAKQLVTEANQTGTTAGSEEWSGIALPLVRRVFGEISAKEFLSTQPMTLPVGLVFYLDFKYATGQPGFNTAAGKDSQNDSLFGITDSAKGTDTNTYGNATPAQGLYGAGRFAYGINDYSSSVIQPGTSLTTLQYTTGSVSLADYNYDTQFSQSLVANGYNMVKVTVSSSVLSTPDLEGVRAYTLSNATGSFVYDQYAQFTKYNKSAKTIQFIVSGSVVAATDRLVVNYHKQPTDVTRGDFEEGKTQAGSGNQILDIPKVDIQFRSEPIAAKTKKLKAEWTPEFSQDINALQSMDVEGEVTSVLGEYISMEIDLELLDMLIANCESTDYWSCRIGYDYNGSNAFAQTATNVAAYNQGTWFQTLGTKMQKMSNRISTLTMRGGANFAVVSPMVATILESIPGYAADTDGDKSSFAMGVQKVGMINSRWTVYKNPYMIENVMLMGYRGAQYLECGAVFAPYIPLLTTPLVLDPDNFTPRKGVMTRYAKKMLRPEFYGKIYVEGLQTL